MPEPHRLSPGIQAPTPHTQVPSTCKRIVLVEDNPGDAALASERLAEAPGSNVQVEIATSLAQAIRLLASIAADAIVLDLNLPDSMGLDTLRRIRPVAGSAPIIVVCGQCDEGLRRAALLGGAEEVFGKDETNSRLFCRSVLYVVERNRARVQQRRLQALLDATPDAILVASHAGNLRFVNAAAVELFDRPRDQLLSEALSFSVRQDEASQISISRRDGVRDCEMRIASLDWDGEPVHVASIRDITLRQQAEALRDRSLELEAQNRRFQEASRLKTEFLANMSHEIRTPMNAIIGLSHLLGQTRLDGGQRSFLDKILIASRSLMDVINDVLDLSKIEAGELALEDQAFELPRLLVDLGRMLQPQAESKEIDLVVLPDAGLPRRVRGDLVRVRQILTNLLSNALKFTGQGQVSLVAEAGPRADGRLDLRFTVSDTGIGIAQADLARLFKPFSQADASTTRRFGGTGLGLSIVRELTQMMGGTVQVASEPGAGSRFTVNLPMVAEDGPSGSAERHAQAFDLLVTETAKGSLRRLRSSARALGWELEFTPPGETTGLSRRFDEGQAPDVWLVDLRLGGEPAHDRVTALGAMRAQVDEAHWPACVVVDGPDPNRTALPAGADADLAHPITAAGLFHAARAALQRRGQGTDRLLQLTRLDAVGVQWLPGVRMLIVDDSEVNLEVARRILEREGAQVRGFTDAGDALACLRTEGGAIDAVLMDVQIPVMDGNAATRLIRAELGLTALPVIALSAGAFVSERQRCLDAGMVDFVSKPLDPDTLIRIVRKHVERARGAELGTPPREGDRAAGVPTWPHIEGIDGPDVAHRLGHDVVLFSRLLARLLREFVPAWPAAPPAPSDAPARDGLASRMHKLRGSAGMLGATAVRVLAGDIEAAARGGAPAAALAARLAALSDELARLAARALPLLEAQAARQASAAVGAALPDPEALSRLVECLQANDLEALSRFDALAAPLRAWLEAGSFERLQDSVQGLAFGSAVEQLHGAVEALRAGRQREAQEAAFADSLL